LTESCAVKAGHPSRRVKRALGTKNRPSLFPDVEQKGKEMSSSETTTDHEAIQKWAEARDGRPAVIRNGGKGGILRIDFGEKEEEFEDVDWNEFFDIFDKNKLAFLYQDETKDGKTSRFNKFVER
jgi:hypothetical protein